MEDNILSESPAGLLAMIELTSKLMTRAKLEAPRYDERTISTSLC